MNKYSFHTRQATLWNTVEQKTGVILEDIINTGRTLQVGHLQTLVHIFSEANIKDFRIAKLFLKVKLYNEEYNVGSFAVKIRNLFVVEHGLDYKVLRRNLHTVFTH